MAVLREQAHGLIHTPHHRADELLGLDGRAREGLPIGGGLVVREREQRRDDERGRRRQTRGRRKIAADEELGAVGERQVSGRGDHVVRPEPAPRPVGHVRHADDFFWVPL